MKTINLQFEDKEFSKLLKAKGDMSWRDFILQFVKGGFKKWKK